MNAMPVPLRLVLTDQRAEAWIGQALAADTPGSRWQVLPLGISSSRYTREHAVELSRLSSFELINVSPLSHRVRDRFREEVLRLMASLPGLPLGSGTTLGDLFCDGEGSLWWYLEVSEKSAYRGPFFQRLYFLTLLRVVLQDARFDEVWLCLEDEQLASCVASGIEREGLAGRAVWVSRLRRRSAGVTDWIALLQCVRFAAGVGLYHALRIVMTRALGISALSAIPSRCLVFFSFYPAMWAEPYGERPKEWFFGSVPEALGCKHEVRYGIWLTASPLEIWRRRAELRRFFRTQPTVCLTLHAGLGALRKIWTAAHLIRLMKFLLKWQQRLTATFAGFDISGLLKEEISRSLCVREFFQDVLLRDALGKLTASSPSVTLLYRLEFSAHEKALLDGIGGRARSVAFQHSLFGRNYLPYYFLPGAFMGTATKSSSATMPLPDLILTSGRFARDVMVRNGIPAARVEVCGPVRYTRLWQYRRSVAPRETIRARYGYASGDAVLVVTTAVAREEGVELLSTVGEVVGSMTRLHLVYKSHPALPLDGEFRRFIGDRVPSSRWRILESGEDLYDFLALADATVLTSSTVALECLAVGSVPLIFETGSVFDPKALEPDECPGLLVRNAAELCSAIEAVRSNEPAVADLKAQADVILRRWFDTEGGDPNLRFMHLLEKQRILGDVRA
jgi:hypothetical protein